MFPALARDMGTKYEYLLISLKTLEYATNDVCPERESITEVA